MMIEAGKTGLDAYAEKLQICKLKFITEMHMRMAFACEMKTQMKNRNHQNETERER